MGCSLPCVDGYLYSVRYIISRRDLAIFPFLVEVCTTCMHGRTVSSSVDVAPSRRDGVSRTNC